jgi:hypothetical protein
MHRVGSNRLNPRVRMEARQKDGTLRWNSEAVATTLALTRSAFSWKHFSRVVSLTRCSEESPRDVLLRDEAWPRPDEADMLTSARQGAC